MRKIIFLISIIALQQTTYTMKRKRDNEKKQEDATTPHKKNTHSEIVLLAKALQQKPFNTLLPHKVLVYGAKGVGKSTQINKLIDSMQASAQSFSAADARIEATQPNGHLDIKKLCAFVRMHCTMAASHANIVNKRISVVHIDHIDLLFSPNDLAKRIGPILNSCIQLAKAQQGVRLCIVGELDGRPTLWFKREFDKSIWITLPNEDERKELLHSLIKKYKIPIDSTVKMNILATKTKGFTPYELESIMSELLLRVDGRASQGDFIKSIEQIYIQEHTKNAQQEDLLLTRGSPSYFR